MAIRTELELGLRGFNANLDAATERARRKGREMEKHMGGLGPSLARGVKGVGGDLAGSLGLAGGVVGIGMALKSTLENADDIADLTLKLNESAEAIQKVDYAAKLAGSDVEQVSDAMIKLERALGEVGNEKAADALDHLGFSAETLAGMSLDEKMIALSDAFQKARAEGTGVNDIQALLGRSSAELIPLLEQGGDALRAMFEEAPVLAEATVQEMAKVNDAIDAMIEKSKGMFASVIGAWVEGNQFVADVIGNMMGGSSPSAAWQEAHGQAADRETEADFEARNRALDREKQGKAQTATAADAAARSAAAKDEKAALDKADKAEDDILKRRAEADKERKRQEEELARNREAAGKGAFGLMSDPDQMASLMETLGTSLGVKIRTTGDAEAGITNLRDLAADLEAEGDTKGASDAYAKLTAAQEDFGRLRDLVGKQMSSEGAVGGLQSLVNQIFGRDPQVQAVEEMKRGNDLARDANKALADIIIEMKKPPTNSHFDNFPN